MSVPEEPWGVQLVPTAPTVFYNPPSLHLLYMNFALSNSAPPSSFFLFIKMSSLKLLIWTFSVICLSVHDLQSAFNISSVNNNNTSNVFLLLKDLDIFSIYILTEGIFKILPLNALT